MQPVDDILPLPRSNGNSFHSIANASLQSLEDKGNITAWLNDLIDGQTSPDDVDLPVGEKEGDLLSLERRVTILSAQLEAACEDTSIQLERTIEEISRTVPRLMYDLQFMRESAVSLFSSVHAIEKQSSFSTSSSPTAQVLERLHLLDTMKQNMTASLSVLREAESWSTLEADVAALLAEQAYTKAAARLAEASKSLGVFENTPEYESRKTLLVNLQNQLEASLSSALVSCINAKDVKGCKHYFEIFFHIERETEFRSYWYGSKRKPIIDFWQSALLSDCDENVDNATATRHTESAVQFSSFLGNFFERISSVIDMEREGIVSIYPDPQATLSAFITSLLLALQPSFSQRLSAISGHYGDRALPEIVAAYKATQAFAVATEKVMEKLSFANTTALALSVPGDTESGSSLQKSASNRRSRRHSVSHRFSRGLSISGPAIIGPTSNERGWDEALFEPFLDYQCDYRELEERYLISQARTLLSTPTQSNRARVLRERSVDILAFAEECLTRCIAFTHGYGALGLIQAIDNLFKFFLDQAEQDILKSDPREDTQVGDDFVDLDYSAAEYASFQLAIHLLEAAKDIHGKIMILEIKLRSVLSQAAQTFVSSRKDPTGVYISGSTRGGLALLQGSFLNSLELQSLLESLESPAILPTNIPVSSSNLQRSRSTPRNPSPEILAGARDAIAKFARSCQSLLQQTILAPLKKQLSLYPSLPVWTNTDNLREKRSGTTQLGTGTTEIFIPSFSLSPSQTVQRVAEGLLSLPRLFEVYADDDALAFSIETLPFMDASRLRALVADEDIGPSESKEHTESDPGYRPRHVSSPSTTLKSLSSTRMQATTVTSEVALSAWLVSLTMTLVSLLTEEILPSIRHLNPFGASQLSEDLGYIIQIVKALNVEWEQLNLWRDLVSLEETELRERAKVTGENERTECKVLSNIMRIRGINL